MTIAQCKAERNRFRMRFRDQAHIGRPIYGAKSVETQQRRLQRQLQKEREMQQRKGRAKK